MSQLTTSFKLQGNKSPSGNKIKQLNDKCFSFIGNLRIDKIKRNIITVIYICEGLKMIY